MTDLADVWPTTAIPGAAPAKPAEPDAPVRATRCTATESPPVAAVAPVARPGPSRPGLQQHREQTTRTVRSVPNEPPETDDNWWRAVLRDDQTPVAASVEPRPEPLPGALLAGLPDHLRAQLTADPDLVSVVTRRAREKQAGRILAEVESLRQRRPEPDRGTLAELLARPHVASFRIDGLLGTGGRMLLVAQRKTGKTTMVGNFAQSLLTGRDFLDRFPVRQIDGRIVVLNFEVSGHQFARWMHDIGVPAERMYVINLRGCRNPLSDEDGRRALADEIRQQNGQVLVVDPFGRAYGGASQNDAAEVTPFLIALDEVTEASGCGELILTAHAGWNAERTRGSSALEDWPDVIVTLNKDEDGQRYFRAEGRDVDIPEDRLQYDPDTRHLSMSGQGSRQTVRTTAHMEDLISALVLAVAHEPGQNITQLERSIRNGETIGFQKGEVGKASRQAEELGRVQVVFGPNRARLHYLPGTAPAGPPDPPSPPEVPPGGTGAGPPDPPSPIRTRGVGGTCDGTTEGAEPTGDNPAVCRVCGRAGDSLGHMYGCQAGAA